eukprot:CAMPEP_0178914916 /NCGR_PEP_ID=MMETSP0786-20121207/11712_1 /TAXON_ID=186022 /ORGANISM="Thalassionema frauenfeldii, Strain CCMP 1798" /LENGTH=840 /DNA_ID=CAMNT_0020587919 /DNA_START=61 /DNA_END=2583 /DNA_ORIENTATION=+
MMDDENDNSTYSQASAPAHYGGAFVPQYSPKNRMLMRSPLPSPTSVRKKKTIRVVEQNNDSDSEDGGYKKREEAHISRLVHMAKAQQHLMTAWFAASAGDEEVVIPMPPRRKSSRRKSSSSSSSGRSISDSSARSIGDSSVRSSSSGPIDLDNGAEWDEEDSTFSKRGDSSQDDTMSLSSQSSSASSKMRAFLTGIIGGGGMSNCATSVLSDNSGNNPSSMIIADGTTPATSYDAEDAPLSKHSMSCCGREWSRNRIILGLLVLIFGIALITILASSLENKNRESKQGQSTAFNEMSREDDGFVINNPPFKLNFPTTFPSTVASSFPSHIPSYSNFPSTLSPSTLPSMSPTMTPSRQPSRSPSTMPSTLPSFVPSKSPSGKPSMSPSQIPTAAPSVTPTTRPSLSPSRSQLPSGIPSSSPSTVFSTTLFEQNLILSGDSPREEFGYGVAMNGAATVVAIGARYHGAEKQGRVQVYQFDSDRWVPKGKPIYGRYAQDQLGWSVALNDDGNILAVSEPGFDTDAGSRVGNIRVFIWNDKDDWTTLGNEIPGEGVAGLSGVGLSLSAEGTRLAIGSPLETTSKQKRQGGRVRVYELQIENEEGQRQNLDIDHVDWSDWNSSLQKHISNSTWQPLGDPLEGDDSVDYFGWSIDLQGDDIAIGAPRNRKHGGYVRLFRWNSTAWSPLGNDIKNDFPESNAQDRFGMSVSLNQNRVAIGAPWKDVAGASNVGLVAVYAYGEDKEWSLTGTPLIGDEPLLQLGLSVCIRGKDYLSVGAPGGPTGRVEFYHFDGQSWDPASAFLYGEHPKEDFGHWVVANKDFTKILVGSPATTVQDYPGSVQVFEKK